MIYKRVMRRLQVSRIKNSSWSVIYCHLKGIFWPSLSTPSMATIRSLSGQPYKNPFGWTAAPATIRSKSYRATPYLPTLANLYRATIRRRKLTCSVNKLYCLPRGQSVSTGALAAARHLVWPWAAASQTATSSKCRFPLPPRSTTIISKISLMT